MSNLNHLFPENSYSSDDEQRSKKQREVGSDDESLQRSSTRKGSNSIQRSQSVRFGANPYGEGNGIPDWYGLQGQRENYNTPKLSKKDAKIQKWQQKSINKKQKLTHMKKKYKKWKYKYKNIHKTARDLLKELESTNGTSTANAGMNAWGNRFI